MAMDLDMLKKQVNVDFDADDEYLLQLLGSAQDAVLNMTNRTSAELITLGGGVWPNPLQHAVLMLASHWYNQREAVASVSSQEVPYGISFLVKPYRKLV